MWWCWCEGKGEIDIGQRGEEFGLCVFLVYGRKDGYVVAVQ